MPFSEEDFAGGRHFESLKRMLLLADSFNKVAHKAAHSNPLLGMQMMMAFGPDGYERMMALAGTSEQYQKQASTSRDAFLAGDQKDAEKHSMAIQADLGAAEITAETLVKAVDLKQAKEFVIAQVVSPEVIEDLKTFGFQNLAVIAGAALSRD